MNEPVKLVMLLLNKHVEIGLSGLIANPKAVASQTWTSKDIKVKVHASRFWEKLGPQLFKNQFALSGDMPNVKLPEGHGWILFPYIIQPHIHKSLCVVWLEQAERQWVRHLRVYPEVEQAKYDNNLILSVFKELGLVS